MKKKLRGIKLAEERFQDNARYKIKVCDVCHLPMFLWKKGDKMTCYSCRKLFTMTHDEVMKGTYQTDFTEGIHRQALGLAYRHSMEERDRMKHIIMNHQNAYPKDIFRWDNKEKLDFNRGRFNRHCFEIVEFMRQNLLKELEGE